MNYIIVILVVLLCILPVIYAAKAEHLFQLTNERMNCFIFRFTLLFPAIFMSGGFLDLFSSMVLDSFCPEILMLSEYTALVFPLLCSCLFIYALNRWIIPKDLAVFDHFNKEFEWYIFLPKNKIPGGKRYGTRYKPAQMRQGRLFIEAQEGHLVLDTRHYRHDIMYLNSGEIVVSPAALGIFQRAGLTGYNSAPVEEYEVDYLITKKKQQISDVYFQLVGTHIMPPLSEQTKLESGSTFHAVNLLSDNVIYYNSEAFVLSEDFNMTREYFGEGGGHLNYPYSYSPHRYWIVSKKVFHILKNEFYFRNWDFMPVILVKNEEQTTDNQ